MVAALLRLIDQVTVFQDLIQRYLFRKPNFYAELIKAMNPSKLEKKISFYIDNNYVTN